MPLHEVIYHDPKSSFESLLSKTHHLFFLTSRENYLSSVLASILPAPRGGDGCPVPGGKLLCGKFATSDILPEVAYVEARYVSILGAHFRRGVMTPGVLLQQETGSPFAKDRLYEEKKWLAQGNRCQSMPFRGETEGWRTDGNFVLLVWGGIEKHNVCNLGLQKYPGPTLFLFEEGFPSARTFPRNALLLNLCNKKVHH